MSRRFGYALLAVLVAASGTSSSSQTQEPRFRGGANLVRVDVYASADGVAVTDLTAEDFEVQEDNAPQSVSSFEFIRAKGPVPESARVEPTSMSEMRARAGAPDTRLFVLFLDTLHVHTEGSFHAASPMAALLDRVVGQDDLVGVMTPEISARNIAFSSRTAPIAEMLRANWAWGERQSATPTDPRENEIVACYLGMPDAVGVAEAMIARRREGRTMDAIRDLVQHLEGLREQRSFVLMLTEGWLTQPPDNTLSRALLLPGGRGHRTAPGGPDGLVVAGGKPQLAERADARGFESCERERALLANQDFFREFELLMRRANRANVSFYPIDARGLIAFDTDLGPGRVMSPSADAQILRSRQDALRRLALETDGEVILNTNLGKAAPKILTDIGSYYLLGYVSTNQKLDGRYRRLTVRVKRPGVTLRARPGYLAPTESEVGAMQSRTAVAAPPSTVQQALARLPGTRRPTPLHLQATGGGGFLQLHVEIDRVTAAEPEWAKGAQMRVEVARADGTGERVVDTVPYVPGTRVYAVRHPAQDQMAPGRYSVRVVATPDGGRVPVIAATEATVPAAESLLGSALLPLRRGPGTGRGFQPTADPRFRRTERLIVEAPLLSAGATIQARLLNKNGQAVEIPFTVSERSDDASGVRVAVAEVTLAPLAPAEYVVEVTATRGDTTERLSYALRIVP